MEDTSFIKLTEEDLLKKIDIDPRIVDSFKRVMKKMQDYFNANGYTSQRNYKDYLEKFLLNSGDKNMRIYVDKIEPVNVEGFYNKEKHEICINEDILNRVQEMLDSTLCHEVIHFLVMHDLEIGKAEPDIIRGGFINEALTEMLTQQMYPKSNAYDAQVSMQRFANLVSGNTNNFSRFLQGFIDARYSSPDWENFREYTNDFQKDFNEAGYINLEQAQNNDNFIKAQRKLISLFIRPYGNKSIEEYIDSISKLIDRPVKDSEYINNTIVRQLDKTLISGLRLKDENLEQVLQQKLTELRAQIAKLKQYEGKKVYEFEFEGRKFTLDGEYNLHGDLVGTSRSWNPREGIMTLNINGKKLSLNVNEIDFNDREEEASQRIKELSSYFNKEASRDLSFIGQASKEQGNLTKIEKFTIPVIDVKTKQKSTNIYIATYGDRIVVLNNASKISDIEHMDLNKYIGVTSTDSKVAAIYADKIGSIENGVMYSILSAEAVENKAITLYAKQLQDLLSPEQLSTVIQSYRSSEDFIDDTEENIKDDAIRLLAEKNFGSLSEEKRNKLFEMVKSQNTRFIISTEDGKIDVSYVFGDKYKTAYKGSSEVLYDSIGVGKYNELYDSISKNAIHENISSRQSLPIDNDGNIIFQTQQSQEYEKEVSSRDGFNTAYNWEQDKKQNINQNHENGVYHIVQEYNNKTFKYGLNIPEGQDYLEHIGSKLGEDYARGTQGEKAELAKQFAKLEVQGTFGEFKNPYEYGDTISGYDNPKLLLQLEKVRGLNIEELEDTIGLDTSALHQDIYVATYEIEEWDNALQKKVMKPIKEYYQKNEKGDMTIIGTGTENRTTITVDGLEFDITPEQIIQGESLQKVTQQEMGDKLIKNSIEDSMKNGKVTEVAQITDMNFLKDFSEQCGIPENWDLNGRTFIVSTINEKGEEDFDIIIRYDDPGAEMDTVYKYLDGIYETGKSGKEMYTTNGRVLAGGLKEIDKTRSLKEFITKSGNRYTITRNADGKLGFNEIFRENENIMQAEHIDTYTYSTNDYLTRTYERAEINQEDLDKAYETINRTKAEREQTQDKTKKEGFGSR